MGAAIALRGDFDGLGLRRLAKSSKDAGQSRRLLALAGGEPTMITNDTNRGISNHFWSSDSRRVLYLQDIGGPMPCGRSARPAHRH